MKRRRLAGLLTVLALVVLAGFIVRSTLRMGRARCEVTMVLDGRSATVAARGATPADATRAAITGACARIASGRTQNILCLDAPPLSVSCE